MHSNCAARSYVQSRSSSSLPLVAPLLRLAHHPTALHHEVDLFEDGDLLQGVAGGGADGCERRHATRDQGWQAVPVTSPQGESTHAKHDRDRIRSKLGAHSGRGQRLPSLTRSRQELQELPQQAESLLKKLAG